MESGRSTARRPGSGSRSLERTRFGKPSGSITYYHSTGRSYRATLESYLHSSSPPPISVQGGPTRGLNRNSFSLRRNTFGLGYRFNRGRGQLSRTRYDEVALGRYSVRIHLGANVSLTSKIYADLVAGAAFVFIFSVLHSFSGLILYLNNVGS